MEKGTKSRRSAAEMESLIMKWEQSGQSRAGFCREAGIPSWTFQYWLSRYREKRDDGPSVGFSEILVKGEGHRCGPIRIKHPCGIEIELGGGTSATYLRELLGW